MASLRVFVSSTCFDLGPIRGQIRSFISRMGYEPIMSDYNDVLYDPRTHTHTSCIEEVATCDLIVLLVGSRFGGKAVPEAISKVDFDALVEKSKSVDHLKRKENISITQLEVLKAVELEIPIFTFIDGRLWGDHELYEKNKAKGIVKEIEFPSIEKPETAEFIFEFVNFLRHRTRGNSINTFAKFEDIEETLKKQWAGLLQKLLNEVRNKQIELKRIDVLSNQFEDLKAAILTTMGNKNQREVARGVVRFRKLIDFLRSFRLPNYDIVLSGSIKWKSFFEDVLGIDRVIDLDNVLPHLNRQPRFRLALIRKDMSFYEMRFGSEFLLEMASQFDSFTSLPSETRLIIFEALIEMSTGMMLLRFHEENFNQYINGLQEEFLLSRSRFKDEGTSPKFFDPDGNPVAI